MKELVLVFLWFVSGIAAKHEVHLVPAHILCPNVSKDHDILLPDPHDCSVYYRCENGLAIPQSCPIGLEWCKILSECTLPILANCTIKHTVVTYSPEELATYKPSGTPKPPATPSPIDTCPNNGARIPNRFDCNSYLECKNHATIIKYCPPNKLYSCWQGSCVDKKHADCILDGSQEGKKCDKNGAKFGHPTDCNKYYECEKKKVVAKSCGSRLEFNPWFSNCYKPNLAHCSKSTPHPTESEPATSPSSSNTDQSVQSTSSHDSTEGTTIGSGSDSTENTGSETTESSSITSSSTITPSPFTDVCPIDGATLPNQENCKQYFECKNHEPVPRECPSDQAYDCWEQKCTAEEAATCINQGNQTGHSCSNHDEKLPINNNCTSYYICENGSVITESCAPGTYYNRWFGSCVKNSLAHCHPDSSDTTSPGGTEGTTIGSGSDSTENTGSETTESSSSTSSSTITPSPITDICPIDGALSPNPNDCSTYFRCENMRPVLKICEQGFAYSCWDQKCLPASDADCIAVGSQQDKNCSKPGQRLSYIEDCSRYYECENGKVIIKQCVLGKQFNKWFGTCLPKSLSHCEPHSTLSPSATTSLPLTTLTPSPTHDICPINGSLLPNPSNCSSYYICENGIPTIHYCDKGLQYSCWDQVCLPPSKANCIAVGSQTGKNCSKEGQKTQNPDNCHTYYECVNGSVETKFCQSNHYYSKWFRKCLPSLFLSHCKIDPTKTTATSPTTSMSESTPSPSPNADICPMENDLLPNPANCSTYYRCQNNTPILQLCADGLQYSCWDQKCLPPQKAHCIAIGSQTGKKCSKNGERMQNPENCHTFYQCIKNKVETRMCSLNWYYNKWFKICLPTLLLSHCKINKPAPATIAPTTKSPLTNKDICPNEGSLQPDPENCDGYYKCENYTAVKQHCPTKQEYSCWDQTCLPAKDAHCIAVGSQEGLNCSREGERLQNIESCYSYFECCKGKVVKQYCAPLLQYNKWYSECRLPNYAHCKTFNTKPTPTTTTTTTTTNTTTYKPPTSVVCPTDGAKVPNPKNCKQYFVCDKRSPVLYNCPPGYSYDCWNEACNPTSIARCVSAENVYVGDKCTQNGRTIPKVSDCNRYYECDNGEIVEKKCRFLLQYSVWRSKCVLIGLAKCANNAFLGII